MFNIHKLIIIGFTIALGLCALAIFAAAFWALFLGQELQALLGLLGFWLTVLMMRDVSRDL